MNTVCRHTCTMVYNTELPIFGLWTMDKGRTPINSEWRRFIFRLRDCTIFFCHIVSPPAKPHPPSHPTNSSCFRPVRGCSPLSTSRSWIKTVAFYLCRSICGMFLQVNLCLSRSVALTIIIVWCRSRRWLTSIVVCFSSDNCYGSLNITVGFSYERIYGG
jgi:hypothetical protein